MSTQINTNINASKLAQTIIAYASVVFAVLTSTLNGIHLPPVASAILGIFGILLHPQTSITVPNEPAVSGPKL